ncbi:heavy-metal-associated domain-containing protein [Aquitalea sp. LB_tupeE]|uniref:heavy-metal-associated domain-containing protein n=1 Tax=Aquitalea sp. LB_tupeE TaxID=2748078 RepID=UPI0015BD98E0|nr:heavy metal-associated domain-containing protein [Aquitalea sp. LB_tupeE]NWK76827.1 heavy-metal-associated domain-containing protein [Aquitalea sp. LB_tupeE]
MSELKLKIEGMTCGGCANSINKVLSSMAGVSSAEVSLQDKQASIVYDAATVSPEELAAAVEDAGFDVVAAE